MTRDGRLIPENQFFELYHQGLGDYKIGKRLGFSKDKISYFRRKRKLPTKTPRSLSERKQLRIVMLMKEGFTFREIAKDLKCSCKTVRKYCKLFGLIPQDLRNAHKKKTMEMQNKLFLMLLCEGPSLKSEILELFDISPPVLQRMTKSEVFQTVMVNLCLPKASRSSGVIVRRWQRIPTIISMRDDPRLVDKLVELISFEVKDKRTATKFMWILKPVIGKERAEQVIEKLGYEYSRTR